MAEPNIVRESLFNLQVCVPAEFTDAQVEKYANTACECGTTKGWTICRQAEYDRLGLDDPWANERVQCELYPENVHIMLDA